jgi:DNA-binding Lrp family transcriptional regulator
MTPSRHDLALIAALRNGLPLVSHPYAEIGKACGLDEGQVIARLGTLLESGVLKRFGVVVRHHELGYSANAMSVWEIPEDRIDEIGARLGAVPCVTLCYRRPRRPPVWPYNLFCMIHGKDREAVKSCIQGLIEQFGLAVYPHDVLFSTRRFKQTGGRYGRSADEAAA